jgi:hypothetical protein
MKSRARVIGSRYIVALVVVLWVLGFTLSNRTLDGFFLVASFPLIIWLLLRLVLAAVRRLRGSGASSQTLEAPASQDLSPQAEPTTVYVTHAWWLVFATGLATVVTAGFGTSFLDTATGVGMVIFGIGFFCAAAYTGYETLRLIRHADSGLPILRFDQDGLECVYGRVHWGDVLFVSSEEAGQASIWLLFVLRPGTAWEPVETNYSPYTVARVLRGGLTTLRVGLWTRYRNAMQIVNSYYRPSDLASLAAKGPDA